MSENNTKKDKKPFIPPKLPPEGIDCSELIKDIGKTREAIARYDEALKKLPNPYIIQHSFETKEAVLSSKIEGTQVTLNEVLELDVARENKETTKKERDYREVVNYREAIREGQKMLSKKPLSENVIKKLHKILLDSVRGKNKAPGKFRRRQVYIGDYGTTIEDARYIPPPPQDIIPLFSDLVKYINSDKAPDPTVQIAISHYQFEAIHPFADGNGRVGRIIVPLFLHQKEVTFSPNIYVSEFLEKNREEYYDKLKAVSEKKDWFGWIKFFLKALREQSKVTSERVEKVNNLYGSLMDNSAEFNSAYTPALIEAIFKLPVFNIPKLHEVSGIKNRQTVYNLVNKLIKKGLIVDITPDKKRYKVYAFKKLLDIVN